MEHIGKFVAYLILAVNALFVGTLILSAYSPYLNPKINPLASSLGLAFPIFLTINLIFIGFWAFVNYRYALLPAIGFLICIPQIRTYIPILQRNEFQQFGEERWKKPGIVLSCR